MHASSEPLKGAINSDHAYVVLIDFLTGQINVTMLFGLFSNDVSYKFGASGHREKSWEKVFAER